MSYESNVCVCVCGERMFAMNRSHDSNIVQAEVIAACWHFTCAQRFTGTHLSSNGTITQRVSITVKHHTVSLSFFFLVRSFLELTKTHFSESVIAYVQTKTTKMLMTEEKSG